MAEKIRGLRTLILSLSGLLVYVVIFLITKGIDPVNLGIGLSILLAPGFGANAVKSVWHSKVTFPQAPQTGQAGLSDRQETK